MRVKFAGAISSWSAQLSPEQAPERFAAVHAAYQKLRDPVARLRSQIFDFECEDDSLETLATDLRQRLRDVRLPVQTLLSLADSS